MLFCKGVYELFPTGKCFLAQMGGVLKKRAALALVWEILYLVLGEGTGDISQWFSFMGGFGTVMCFAALQHYLLIR